MQRRAGQVCGGAFRGRLPGAGLPEVLVATVILAIILVSVPPVLGLIVKSQYAWNEQRVAESLSRNQMEFIKVTQYIPGNAEYATVPVPDGTYEIDVVAQPIDPDTKAPVAAESDVGMQRITMEIYHGERMVLRTVNYKVDRLDVLSL